MKLLYITYIDLNNAPLSGSTVRPLKMLQAFEEIGLEVVTVSGMNNNLRVRQKAVDEIKKKLAGWTPDVCYIEPPSGPMFYWGDLSLIRLIRKKGIPAAIFYRDAYWKYPDYFMTGDASRRERMKQKIIKMMQQYQWNVFTKTMNVIYFPSVTMAEEFRFDRKDILPPGAFIPEMEEKRELSEPLQFIFVGGAAKNHGTFLTVDAFEKVNRSGVIAKVFYICPEEQWRNLGIDKEKYSKWLKVIHASGDESLKGWYEKADIALLTAPRTFYRDFAVPIKVYEYMSYLKPMLVTNCTETARIVNDNHVGWVVEDSVDAVAEKIRYLAAHPEEVNDIRKNMYRARESNLWTARAEKVLNDLK